MALVSRDDAFLQWWCVATPFIGAPCASPRYWCSPRRSEAAHPSRHSLSLSRRPHKSRGVLLPRLVCHNSVAPKPVRGGIATGTQCTPPPGAYPNVRGGAKWSECVMIVTAVDSEMLKRREAPRYSGHRVRHPDGAASCRPDSCGQRWNIACDCTYVPAGRPTGSDRFIARYNKRDETFLF